MQETALIVVALVAITAGCTAVTFVWSRLPWPRRVRWMVAANALGSWGMPTEPFMIREVFVVDVWSSDGGLSVVVRAWGSTSYDTTLVAGHATMATSAQAARWRAAGTPLLLVSNGTGSMSLHGPTLVLCELVVQDTVNAATRSSRTGDTPPIRDNGQLL